MEAKRAADDGAEPSLPVASPEPTVPTGSGTEPTVPTGSGAEPTALAGSGAEPSLPVASPEPTVPTGSGTEPTVHTGSAAEPTVPTGAGTEPTEPTATVASQEPTATATPHRRRRPGAGVVALFVIAGALLVGAGALAWWVFGTTWLARDAAAGTTAQLRADWAAASAESTGSASAEATPSSSGDDASQGDDASPGDDASQGDDATASPDTPSADEETAPAPALPGPGEAAWILTIPAIGLETPILAGVEPAQLHQGVGWYPSTALPGQVGNFALAGLRITNGAPFADLLDLRVGDEVIVETADAVFTYEIISAPADLTVQADESWVLDPVPGEPDTVPGKAVLTLTTEEDLITTPDRSVGFGTLEKAETK